MKKLLVLCLMFALGATVSFAQDSGKVDGVFQFVDKNGKVIPNGSEWTAKDVSDDGFEKMIKSNLFVKNTSSEDAYIYVKMNVTYIDGGSVSICFPQNCMPPVSEVKGIDTTKGMMTANESKDLQTEWIIDETPENTKCVVTYELIRVECLGGVPPTYGEEFPGSKITVNYLYGGTTGIDATRQDKNVEVVGHYNANGQVLQGDVKGLNIQKLSNGKTIKYMVR